MSEPVDEFGARIANQVLNAFEVTGSDIGVSMDLTQVTPLLVPRSGTSDVASLDYGGPLNLLASTEPRVCGMHSDWGEHLQCPRCAEILMVRRLRGRIVQLTELASAYEKGLCVCPECVQQPGHSDHQALARVNELLDDLGLRWDDGEDGFV